MSRFWQRLAVLAGLVSFGCAGGKPDVIQPQPSGSGGSGGSGGASPAGKGGAGGSTTAGNGGASGHGGSTGAGGAPGGATINFSEDFESSSEVATSWIAGDTNGTWTLINDGSSVYQGTAASNETLVAGGNAAWTDQIVEVRVKVTSTGSSSWIADVMPRLKGLDDYYQLSLYSSGLQLHKRQAGTRTQLGDKYKPATPPAVGTFYTIKVEVSDGAGGATITAWLDDVQALTFLDASPIPAGGIGLGVEDATAEFDDVKVTWP
jgi:pectate lyase